MGDGNRTDAGNLPNRRGVHESLADFLGDELGDDCVTLYPADRENPGMRAIRVIRDNLTDWFMESWAPLLASALDAEVTVRRRSYLVEVPTGASE